MTASFRWVARPWGHYREFRLHACYADSIQRIRAHAEDRHRAARVRAALPIPAGTAAGSRAARSPTRAGARCATCASRSPTAATSAAPTACRRDVFDADYEFLPHAEMLTFEEIVRLARIFRGLGIAEDPPHRRRAAAAPGIERLVGDAARGAARTSTSRSPPTARRSRRKARALAPPGCDRITVSLDSLDDATFRAMNDVDFPVAKVLEGIDAAADGGLAPVKVNMVVKRGVNDHAGAWTWRGASAAPGTSCASSSSWTWARPTAGAWTTWSPRPRSCGASPSASRSSRSDANYAGEVAERWRYRRRRRARSA